MARWKCLAILWLVSTSTVAQGETSVLVNVQVLTMEQTAILQNQAVIIQGETITEILPVSQYQQQQSDHIIDGGGGTVVPGLIDTHIHIDHAQDLKMLALYGVTSAVNMRGLPWHLRLREEARKEGHFGPDFLTAGDYLDGSPPDMLPMASVAGTDTARRTVSSMHRAGFDFIKVYSELSRDQYLAICDQASALGIPVAGHLPDAVTLQDVVSCPHVNVAHGEQLFKLLKSREDPGEIRTLVQALGGAELTVTANMALHAEGARMPFDLEQLLNRPEAELIHPATFQPYRPGINRYARRSVEWAQRVNKVVVDLRNISRIAAVVSPSVLVAGSDAPVAGAYPGVSLVAEIRAYHQAGLTRYQSLATATTSAARLLQLIQPGYPKVGVVAPGARADLLLVNGNPLKDLGALSSPRGVMLRGRFFNQSAMAGIRNKLIEANRKLARRVKTLESAVFSKDLLAAHRLFNSYRAENPSEILFAQYPFFFFGFSLLYGDNGLTEDSSQAEKAVLLYDMYRQTYPEFHSSHHVYGLALEARGDLQGALAAQKKALAIFPDYPPGVEAVKRLEKKKGSLGREPYEDAR